jgi:hypothetical protein
LPISREYQAVFVHIPRTGGTTIEKLLGIHREWPEMDLEVFHGRFDQGDDYCQLQHLSYPEMEALADISHTHPYFKFSMVRNPWDRLVSEYFWQNLQDSLPFPSFVDRTYRIVTERERITGAYCHFRPQVEFVTDDLDWILRFEEFPAELERLCARLGIQLDRIPRFGATPHEAYPHYYDANTEEMVAHIYQADIERFGYAFIV